MKQSIILFLWNKNKFLIIVGLIFTITACNTAKEKPQTEYQDYRTELRNRLMQEMGNKYDISVSLQNNDQSIDRGKEIYMQVCASCHGIDGLGDGVFGRNLPVAPSNFTDPKHATFYSENARLHIIRKGIDNSPMMGWESILSEDDLFSVFYYIRSLINVDQNEK